jgi:small subunit ribosomal protein S5
VSQDESNIKEEIPLAEVSPVEEPVKAELIVKKHIKKISAEKAVSIENWQPKTKLGKMVKEGKITNMSDAIATRLALREPEIVDILLPDLEDEVLDVNMVQRMTDSGRRVKFAITIVVGNSNGYVGIGHAKGKEVRLAILKAIDSAKINIMQIKRGCGSWECGCGLPHSLPFEVTGKCGSAVITLRPAPRGVSLAAADVAKHILRLGGIRDAWTFTNGKTRTTVNFAFATFDALKKTGAVKVTKSQEEKLKIITGGVAQ